MSKWFIQHRQDFIRDQLKTFGQVRRADLCAKFDISMPQAATDLALFLRENPDVMVFDGRSRCYVLNEAALSEKP